MNIKNNLLSEEILKQITDRTVQITIKLSATPCQNKWPKCRMFLNNDIKFDGEIQESRTIEIEHQESSDEVNFKIEIYGKTSQDTTVDQQGQLLENMSMHIEKLKINGANIIDNGYIMNGKYKMILDPEKKKYYETQGFPQENNDHHFYENGVWSIDFSVPVLGGIIEKVRTLETYETIPYQHILKEIYKRITQ